VRGRRWLLSAVALAICACGKAPTVITGPLVVHASDGCVYVRGPHEGYTDLYWVRTSPDGYSAGAAGIAGPEGAVLSDGQSVTVTGNLTGSIGDTRCVGVHILDATSIR